MASSRDCHRGLPRNLRCTVWRPMARLIRKAMAAPPRLPARARKNPHHNPKNNPLPMQRTPPGRSRRLQTAISKGYSQGLEKRELPTVSFKKTMFLRKGRWSANHARAKRNRQANNIPRSRASTWGLFQCKTTDCKQNGGCPRHGCSCDNFSLDLTPNALFVHPVFPHA